MLKVVVPPLEVATPASSQEDKDRVVLVPGRPPPPPRKLAKGAVADSVRRLTGLPDFLRMPSVPARSEMLLHALQRRVIGQDHVLRPVVERIQMIKAGLCAPRRPLAAFGRRGAAHRKELAVDPVKAMLAEYDDDVGLEPDERPTPEVVEAAERDMSPHWFWLQVFKRRCPDATVWCHEQVEHAPDLPLKIAGALRPGENGIRVEPANDSGPKPVPRKPRAREPVEGAMLTASQVANLLNVARTTVEAIPATELPFAHVGKGRQRLRRRYRKEDVEAYIQRLCVRSADHDQCTQEHEQWARADSSRRPVGRTGISASTIREPAPTTESRRTPRRAMMEENPFAQVKDVVDDGAPAGRALDLDEFGGLAHCSEAELRRWMLVTGLHGLRKGETTHLRPEDINVEEGFLHIRTHHASDGTLVWRPKFGKERKVPMVETALPFLSRLRDMPTDKQGHVLGVHDRRKAFARAIIASQIRGHVRFHDRHSAYTKLKDEAMRLLDPKLALAYIKLIFGHSDVSMDAVHDHRTVDRLRQFIPLTPLVKPVEDLLAA